MKNEKKYMFVYMTTLSDGYFYIGQHKTDDLNDNYIGSGHRLFNHLKSNPKVKVDTRHILCFCKDQKKLNNKEAEYIKFYSSDSYCLNIVHNNKVLARQGEYKITKYNYAVDVSDYTFDELEYQYHDLSTQYNLVENKYNELVVMLASTPKIYNISETS